MIKNSNKILFDFETFIINCYASYEKYKRTLELIVILQKFEREDL
jgi:hypothetical protein